MLGRKISANLLEKGHQVAWLSRGGKSEMEGIRIYDWKPASNWVDHNAIEWADAVINLAGESIGETPWNENGKKLILSSRLDAVHTLTEALKKRIKPIQSFVGVSGVGIYGPSTKPKSEEDKVGSDFPAMVANEWELAYNQISDSSVLKLTIIRLAAVLSTEGGALPKIMSPIKFGLGASLGSGLQPLNWIHIDDASEIFCQALAWEGIYNASAPEIINNQNATKAIAKVMRRPLIFSSIPAFVLKLILGDRSQLVLTGNITNTQKLSKTGFTFKFPKFTPAISDLVE